MSVVFNKLTYVNASLILRHYDNEKEVSCMECKEIQAPIQSPYGHFTKSMGVMRDADLQGKIAIVTGGYTGIGIWTTRALVKKSYGN